LITPVKRLVVAFGPSAAFAREITDALVMFSIAVVAYMALANWGGLALLHGVLGVEIQSPSFLYFFGVALVLFSMRRIGDQRSERARRLAAELDVQTLAMRDPLTQLPNRRQFQNELSAALKTSDNKMSVLLLGLAQFKKLNEVYGHLGCDEALVQIGARVRDFATAGDIFARLGDDEFALCLAGGDPSRRARSPARWSSASRARPDRHRTDQHRASVGIAQAGRGHVTVDELLRCAHVALSRARTIHTEYCFFDPKMDAHIRERSLLEKDLRAAIGGDAIQPYYQPIVDLKTRRIVSFESLARWHNPVSGLILPTPSFRWRGTRAFGCGVRPAVRRRLPRCRRLARRRLADVQLLAVPTGDRSFADAVLAVLADTGFPPHRLEAEITESALVEDLEATRRAIQALRNAGVRIVIDDFGTGYSSLYHLYELRFDKLKIDRRFVQELVITGESAVFIRAMVGLCRGLNLSVTAEGIETEAQAAAALEHGVDQAQGFLFGRAVPASEVPALLAAGPVRLAA